MRQGEVVPYTANESAVFWVASHNGASGVLAGVSAPKSPNRPESLNRRDAVSQSIVVDQSRAARSGIWAAVARSAPVLYGTLYNEQV